MQRAAFGKRMTAQASLSTLDRSGASEDVARFVQDVLETSEAPAGKPRTTPAPLENIAWSYFKACVVAFATALLVSAPFIGSGGSNSLLARIGANAASGLVMIQLAPMMLIPIRILSDVARLARIPRGYSDVLIGGLCGSLMMLPDLHAGVMPRPMSFCFIFGGCFGGLYYWRRRGYPGLARGELGFVERIYRILRRVRGRLAT